MSNALYVLSAVKDLSGEVRKNNTWTLGSVRGNIVTKVVCHYFSKFCVIVLYILSALRLELIVKLILTTPDLIYYFILSYNIRPFIVLHYG